MYTFADTLPPPDPCWPHYNTVRPSSSSAAPIPIVLDVGSYSTRAGFASLPDPILSFPSMVGRPRAKKDQYLSPIVGNDILPQHNTRFFIKSPLEAGVITHLDFQELLFDHAFSRLGIDTEGRVEHPVIMSEVLCNPNYCRAKTTELLFETYAVPQVCYGVDSLFSLYHNRPDAAASHALVVSSGHHATYVLPVINGRVDATNAKRFRVAGQECMDFAQRLVECRQPGLRGVIWPSRVRQILEQHCYVAENYGEELERWANVSYADTHKHVFQLPFVRPQPPSEAEVREAAARKEAQRERMREMQRKLSATRIGKCKERLDELQRLQDACLSTPGEDLREMLAQAGFASEEALGKDVETLRAKYRQMLRRQRAIDNPDGADEEEEEEDEGEDDARGSDAQARDGSSSSSGAAEDKYPLVNVSDAALSEEQRAEKRRQRFLKSMAEGRMRARAAREEEKRRRREKEEEQQRLRESNLSEWLEGIRAQRRAILEVQEQRKRKREELSDRRSGAAKARMRLLVQQAQGSETVTKGRGKKKADEDTFGANDDDWLVYKEINREGDEASDQEAEEVALEELEKLLAKHDPTYVHPDAELTIEQKIARLELEHQIQLSVERVRIPEVVFQPSMIGIDQAGLIETINYVLPRYPPHIQSAMVQNMFLTGGNTSFPGFLERTTSEMMAILPFRSEFRIFSAMSPVLDAWRGAAAFARREDFLTHCISRRDYDEYGSDYLKEHMCSNIFVKPL